MGGAPETLFHRHSGPLCFFSKNLETWRPGGKRQEACAHHTRARGVSILLCGAFPIRLEPDRAISPPEPIVSFCSGGQTVARLIIPAFVCSVNLFFRKRAPIR